MKTSPGEQAVGFDGDGCKQPGSSLPGLRMSANCVCILPDVLVQVAMCSQNAAHAGGEGCLCFHAVICAKEQRRRG